MSPGHEHVDEMSWVILPLERSILKTLWRKTRLPEPEAQLMAGRSL